MKKFISLFIAGAMVMAMASCGATKEYRSVNVEKLSGEVSLERENEAAEIFEGTKLIPMDKVETGAEALATLLVDSDKHIVASENTVLNINAAGNAESGKVTVELTRGEAEFTIDNKLSEGDAFEVITPNATMSVRGTKFVVRYDEIENKTYVSVLEGTVAVKSGDAERNVEADEEVVVSNESGIEDYVEDTTYYVTGIIYKLTRGENVAEEVDRKYLYSNDGAIKSIIANGNMFDLIIDDNGVIHDGDIVEYENQNVLLFAGNYGGTLPEGGIFWIIQSDDGKRVACQYNKYGYCDKISNNWSGSETVIDEEEVQLDEHGNCVYYKGNSTQTVSYDDGYDVYNVLVEYRNEFEYDDKGNMIKSTVTKYNDGGIDYSISCEYEYTALKDMEFVD